MADPLNRLENELEALRRTFEQYFSGIEKKIPARERDRLKKQIRNFAPGNNAVLRFRHQNLVQRMTTIERYWERILRAIENGTYERDIRRANRKEQERSESEVELKTQELKLEAEEDLQALFQQLGMRGAPLEEGSRPVEVEEPKTPPLFSVPEDALKMRGAVQRQRPLDQRERRSSPPNTIEAQMRGRRRSQVGKPSAPASKPSSPRAPSKESAPPKPGGEQHIEAPRPDLARVPMRSRAALTARGSNSSLPKSRRAPLGKDQPPPSSGQEERPSPPLRAPMRDPKSRVSSEAPSRVGERSVPPQPRHAPLRGSAPAKPSGRRTPMRSRNTASTSKGAPPGIAPVPLRGGAQKRTQSPQRSRAPLPPMRRATFPPQPPKEEEEER